MSNYQQKVNELLECCQNEWVTLEQLATIKKKEPSSPIATTPTLRDTSRDLREGIKKLVHLQDQLDEIGTIVEKNTEWIKKADLLIEDVRKKLETARNLTAEYVQPTVSQSSPVKLGTVSTTVDNDKQTRRFSDYRMSDIQEYEEDKVDLTKRDDIPTQQQTVITTNKGYTITLLKDDDEEEQDQPEFGQKSPEDLLSLSKKKTSKKNQFLKNLIVKASQSTPVKPSYLSTPTKDEQAHINFYDSTTLEIPSTDASSTTPSTSCSSATSTSSSSYIFATDATVTQPLRVGIGYSSYICYNCTIFSDKGSPITVRKRYSDFVELKESLMKEYPTLRKTIPNLPPKKVVGKFTPSFVEQRRKELEYFFKYIVLHPTLGGSSIVKQWIIAH